jgi:NTE family protein
MAELFATMKKSDYIDPSWLRILGSVLLYGRGLTGLLEGKRLYAWLKRNLPVPNIENTCIPLAINVTNVSKQIPEILTKGDLAAAVRASTAIPFVFKPQKIGDSYYVDGGAVNNIPLDEAAKMFPEADAYIIITTFGIKNTEDPADNSWIRKPLAPLFLLSRTLHAISRELYKDNLNAAGKKVAILSIDPGPIDLQQIEKFTEAYQVGLADARRKVPKVLQEIGYK